MNTGGSGLDHRFYKFEDIQDSPKTGLSIRKDWSEPVDIVFPFLALDLVCSLQRLINALDD